MRLPSILTRAALVISLCGSVQAMPREVEFRDGSRLLLDLKDIEFELLNANPDKKQKPGRAKLSDASEVVFSSVPALQRVVLIRKALQDLRAEEFVTREHAAQKLAKIGAGFRELLQSKLDSAVDPEVRWRLNRVLNELPRSTTDDYDHLRMKDGAWRGEIGTWQMKTAYRGSDITLGRETVRAIRKPRTNGQQAKGEDALEVVRSDEPADLPAAAQRIGFDRDAAGKELRQGMNISRSFIDWGCVLSTSIGDSHVSVNPFSVAGARGGQSAATHNPLYEGTITIRFCMPGDADRPAGVHFVGCWLAIVEPGGTSLVAYDAYGAEIGRAVTSKEGSEFIGVRCARPIAYAQIVPTVEIDSNFTFDDLTFDTPQPLSAAADPIYFAVLLRDGARLHCKAFSPEGKETGDGEDMFGAEPASGFTQRIRFQRDDIAAVLPPLRTAVEETAEFDLWTLLGDGSQLRMAPEDLTRTLRGRIPLDTVKIAALWNSRSELRPAPKDLKIPAGGAAVLLRNDPIYLSGVERRIAELAGKRDDDSTVIYNYGRLPTVWFSPPPAASDERGELVLTNGERLSFGPGANFTLGSLGADGGGVEIRVQAAGGGDDPFALRYSEIYAIRFPTREAAP